jgi:Na+/H+ antiporter NhaC
MGMLLPLVVGLAFTLGEPSPLGGRGSTLGGYSLMVISIAAVIEGAIFGDHCSPLASTTILSSISSAADLIDHVRTQLPYGVVALLVALVTGWFPSTFLGWSPWLSLAVGCAVLLMVVFVFGRKSEPAAPPPQPAPAPGPEN